MWFRRIIGRGTNYQGDSAKRPLKSQDKLLYLESVRGLAAIVVVFAHILTYFFPYPEVKEGAISHGSTLINNLFYELPLGFLIAGHFSVIIFFVLSGYVLTYRYYQTGATIELQKQAAKRYFRLAIPVFCTVFISYIMLSTGMMSFKDQVVSITGSPDVHTLFDVVPEFGAMLYNATIGVFANSDVRYNPVLWTMPIELIGSFVIFGIALLVGKLKYRWLFYVGAIVVLSQTYYVGFILGVILADAYHNTKLIEWFKRSVSGFYVVLLLLIALILASIPMPWTSTGDLLHTFSLSIFDRITNARIAHYIGAFIILLIVISNVRVQKILSFKPFVWLGSLSFPVYLTHFLILYSLGAWLFIYLWARTPNIYIVSILTGGAVIVATLIVSTIWKKYIDDMSVAVSRRMAQILLKEKS